MSNIRTLEGGNAILRNSTGRVQWVDSNTTMFVFVKHTTRKR